MDRKFYLDLAAGGLRMPVGADLVLREKPDHHQILLDGNRLGKVLEETAHRFRTPLAFPVMDLTFEKEIMLQRLGVPQDQIATYHFSSPPTDKMMAMFTGKGAKAPNARVAASIAAITYVAKHTMLVPVGMTIGPFSLMSKLLGDPITPVYLAASGVTADEDPEVLTVERTLEMAIRIIEELIDLQAQAGAKAFFIAEPAANKVYISPKQIEAGSNIFDRYVMTYMRRAKKRISDHGMDLIFHCCGELIDPMLKAFTTLDPAILSLGSSRKLWEDAAVVPKTTVLYGNLPSKKFYSDDAITVPQVEALARDLLVKMKAAGHPFILGSECDVLSVPGCEKVIMKKIDAFMDVKV